MAEPSDEITVDEVLALVEGATLQGAQGDQARTILERLIYSDLPASKIAVNVVSHPTEYGFTELPEYVTDLLPIAPVPGKVAPAAAAEVKQLGRVVKPLAMELYAELTSETPETRKIAQQEVLRLERVLQLRRQIPLTTNASERERYYTELRGIASPLGNTDIEMLLEALNHPDEFNLRVVRERPPPGRPPSEEYEVTALGEKRKVETRGRPPKYTIERQVVSVSAPTAKLPKRRKLLPRKSIPVTPLSRPFVLQGQVAKRISAEQYQVLISVWKAAYLNPMTPQKTKRALAEALTTLGEEVPGI